MKPILATDQFSINGVPSDIDAMGKAFPQGWYQLTKGMEVNIMARLAWPVYSKYYGPYHFFQAVPDDGNWFYQDWLVYAEACARLLVLVMGGQMGGSDPMVDVEGGSLIPDSLLPKLFPNMTLAQQRAAGYALLLRELKCFCDTFEALTGKLLVIYTGKAFWEMIGGASATWAARHKLCVAVYPYDDYADPAEYLAAIEGVMAGTKPLPGIEIPAPWTRADYIQITGRLPVTLIPGYAKEPNWAKTADMSIVVNNAPIPAPASPSGAQPAFTSYLPIAGYNPNVHAEPNGLHPAIGLLPPDTVVEIDNNLVGAYGHFQPTQQFKAGGWVYMPYMQKKGN